MALIENRFFWYPEKKDLSVFRIICLGDSMTFGVGVNYEETLPAQLEKNLNRVLWEPTCEVINAGISGFSLYDEWHFYISDMQRYNPDLIIIALCENDIELFSVQQDYRKHIEDCWNEEKPYIHYFSAFFNQIGNYTSASGIPCLITFYDISGDLEKFRYASIIQKNCEENGLDFVNLAEEFTGEYSSTNYKALNASPVDPHPSSIAHQIAVQKISRYLIRKGKIAGTTENNEEKTVYRKLFTFGDNLFKSGLTPEACIYRIQEIIDSKKSGKARAGLEKEQLIEESEYQHHCESLSDEMDLCVRTLYIEGTAERFVSHSMDLFSKLNIINNKVLESCKEIYVLERNLRDPSLMYLPPRSNGNDHDVDISLFISRINVISESLKVFEQNFVVKNPLYNDKSLLPDMHRNLHMRYSNAVNILLPYFKEIRGYANSFRNLINSFIMIFNNSNQYHSDSSFAGALIGILEKLSIIIDYLEFSVIFFPTDKHNTVTSVQRYKPFTECCISIKSACSSLENIILISESSVPYRSLLQDTQYIINDNTSHLYVFKLPVFTYGTIILKLTTIDKTVIESIQIYNDPQKTLVFNQIPIQNTITLSDLLIPL